MSIRILPCNPLAIGALIGLLTITGPSQAQKPVPLGQPNPLAPTIAAPAPLGMQRGTSMELTLTGTNLAGPTALQTSFPAKITFPDDNNNGKDNAKLRVRLEVPADAPIGYHSIRLASTRGLSNVRLFCIDDLAQVLEVDTNRDLAAAQQITVPAVVVGRADAERSDFFKFSVKAGQRLSFEVLGRRLGSAFDPLIKLYDVRTSREMPGGDSDDSPGCQTDARLVYTFKEAGDYAIEVRDSKYAGGPDFLYRLRIGDFPFASNPMPMAAKRGSKVKVSFAGPHVEGVAPVEVTIPAEPTATTVWVAPRGPSGQHGWPVALAVSDREEVVGTGDNQSAAKAMRIPVPGGVTGRLLRKAERDFYVFPAKKGQKLLIEATTLELYSPALVYMVVSDAKGAELARTTPAQPAPADQRIEFTAPADGDYTVAVEHLNHWGGPEQAYHVAIGPSEAGFDVALGLDRYDLAPGGSAVLVIQTVTRRGYNGPIELSVVGHPGLTGNLTLQPGPAPQPNQPAALMFLSAKSDTPAGPHNFQIQAKATIDGKQVVTYANVRNVVSLALAGLPFPPRQLNTVAALTVTPKPPFTLQAKFDLPESIPGSPATVTITAIRDAGFVEEIALTPVGLPPAVTAAVKPIPKEQNELKVQLATNPKTPLGEYPILFMGKAKFQNQDYAFTTSPVTLVMALPFTLKVEPVPVSLATGGKAKVKVIAQRKGGYKGPIALELRNLPANVTAAKVSIAMDQSEVEVEITAGSSATPGQKADVNVLGTATAAGNLQNATPNFTVSVLNK